MHRAPGAGIVELRDLEATQGGGWRLCRLIYQAGTVTEAELQRDNFARKWDAVYPMVSQIWRRNWERITPFFAFPGEIRKVIYTTNAIESLNMSLRKIIKMRGSFPNEEAALKLLYLALRNVSKKWTMPVQNWSGKRSTISAFSGRNGCPPWTAPDPRRRKTRKGAFFELGRCPQAPGIYRFIARIAGSARSELRSPAPNPGL